MKITLPTQAIYALKFTLMSILILGMTQVFAQENSSDNQLDVMAISESENGYLYELSLMNKNGNPIVGERLLAMGEAGGAESCVTGSQGQCTLALAKGQFVDGVVVELDGQSQSYNFINALNQQLGINVVKGGGANNNSVAAVGVVGDKIANGSNLHLFEATVLDGALVPVPSAVVTFAATPNVKFGSGAVGAAGTCTTGAAGTCTVSATSTVAFVGYSTSVSVGGEEVSSGSPLFYNFVAGPATAANSEISVTGSPATAGIENATITITARDAFDNLVDNADVTFDFAATSDVAFGMGNAGDASSCTVLDISDSGTCSVSVTSTVADDYSTAVALGGTDLGDSPAAYTFTPGEADPNNSSFTLAETTEVVNNPVTLTATVQDQFGNLVADGTEVTFNTDFGALSGNACSTVNGVCTDTVNSTIVGTSNITAFLGFTLPVKNETVKGGANQFGGTQSITWTPAAAAAATSAYQVNVDSSTVAQNVTYSAQVADQFGNAVADNTEVTFTLTDSNGASTPATVSCLTSAGACTATATSNLVGDTAVVGSTVASGDFALTPGFTSTNWTPEIPAAATSAYQVNVDSSTVAQNVTYSAQVADQFGNAVVDNTEVTFTLTDSNGASTPATVSCLTSAGACTVTATSNLVGDTAVVGSTVASGDFALTPGFTSTNWTPEIPAAATSAYEVNVDSSTVAQNVTYSAQVADQFGNAVADNTEVTFTLTDSNGASTPATVSCLTSAGACTVTATSNLVGDTAVVGSTVASGDFTLTPGFTSTNWTPDVADATQSIFALSSNTAVVDNAVTLTATIRDEFGNLVADATSVNFATDFGNLSGNACSTTNGLCTDTVNSQTVGTSNITATVGGDAFGGTDSVTWTPAAPAAATSSYEVNVASITAGQDVTYSAQVFDEFSNAVVDDIEVTFTLTNSNGATAPASVSCLTGADVSGSGQCSVTATSTQVGDTAVVASTVVSGDFALTPGLTSTNWTTGPADSTTSTVVTTTNGALADGVAQNVIQVTIVDANDNPVVGELISFGAPIADVNFVNGDTTCISGIDGVCTVSVTSTVAAEYTTVVSISDGELSNSPVSFTFVPGIPTADFSEFGVDLSSQTVGADVTYSAVIRDEFGNLVDDGFVVSFVLTDSAGAVTPAGLTCVTGAAMSNSGACSVSATSQSTGQTVVTASVNDGVGNIALTNVTAGQDTTTWVVGAPSPYNSEYGVNIATQVVGVDVTYSAIIRDASNNPLGAGVLVNFIMSNNGANTPDVSCTTDANGACSVTATSTLTTFDSMGTTKVVGEIDGVGVITAGNVTFSQNITPDTIFGTGNSNGNFTTDVNNGIEVGLRPKIPFSGTTNDNGDGTYSYTLAETDHDNNVGTDNRWNFDWTINTPSALDNYTYQLGLDADPGPGVDYLVFDPVTPTDSAPFFDHSIGDDMTANGAGTEAGDAATYLNLLANNNVLQQSWRYAFFPTGPLASYDPDVSGNYSVYLSVLDSMTGEVLAKSEVQVLIEGAAAVDAPLDTTTWLSGLPSALTSEFGVDLTSQTVGADVTYTAVIQDEFGNLVADGYPVTFLLSDSGGALTPASLVCVTANNTGSCSVSATSQSTGQTVVSASVNDGSIDIPLTIVTAGQDTTNWTVGAPSPYNSEYGVDIAVQTVGVDVTYVAAIRDAFNNPVGAGVLVNFLMNNNGANTPDVSCTTNSSGFCSVAATSTLTTFDSMGTTQVVAEIDGVGVIAAGNIAFDQNITPDTIFGTGNSNGNFTTDVNNGVEVGLRAKIPFAGTINSNGDGTYTYNIGDTWNFDWTINTDLSLDQYTYQLGLDADPTLGVDYLVFDPVTPSDAFPFFDHSIGTDATANGAGTEATDAASYANLLASNNVLQQSWRYAFFPTAPLDMYDPNIPGNYVVYLLVKDSTGTVVAKSEIQVLIGGGAVVEEPLDSTTWLSGLPSADTSEYGVDLTNQTVGGDVTYSAVIRDEFGNLVDDGFVVTFVLTDSAGAITPAGLTCVTGAAMSNSGACSVSATSKTTGQTVVSAVVNDGATDIALTNVTAGQDTTTWLVGIPSPYNSEYGVDFAIQTVGVDVTYSAIVRDAFNNPVGAGIGVSFTMSNNAANTPDVVCTTDVNGACSVTATSTLTTFDSMGTTQVVASIDGVGVIAAGNIDYGQAVSPDVIFGSGNSNGNFTTDVNNGVEVGLRAKIPFNGTINDNGDGTYSYTLAETDHDNNPGTDNRWNFDWTINTPTDLDQYTYQLGLDADPGLGVDYLVFDPVTPSDAFPFFDHSIGTDATANGGGTEAIDAASYANLLANNNVLQQSWRYAFFPAEPLDAYDPDVPGTYSVYLLVRDSMGLVVAKSEIQVLIEAAPPVKAPLDTTTWSVGAASLAVLSVDIDGEIANGIDENEFSVAVTDAFGNPISGQDVTFSTDNAVTLLGNPCNTDNAGECSIQATSTTADMYSMGASVDGFPAITVTPVDYEFISGAADADHSAITSISSGAIADGSFNVITVEVLDAFDNPVANETVTFAADGALTYESFGLGNNGSCSTDAAGMCSINVSSLVAGDYSQAVSIGGFAITAVDSPTLGATGSPAEFTFIAGPPAGATSSYQVSTASEVAATAVTYSAVVRDANNNLVADGNLVTFNLQNSNGANLGGTINGATTVSCTTGAALGTSGTGSCSVSATSLKVGDTAIVSVATAASGDFANAGQDTTNWTPGAASAANSDIVVTDSPATADNVDSVTLTATVRDINDNLVNTADTVTFTQPGDITLSSLTCNANDSALGQCFVTAQTTKASTYNSAASLSGGVIDNNISYEFVAGPVDFDKSFVTVLTDNAFANGSALNELEASLFDAFFNPVKNTVVAFAATPNVNFGIGSGVARTCNTGQAGSCSMFASSVQQATYTTSVTVSGTDLKDSPISYTFVDGDVDITTSTVTASLTSVDANGVDASVISVQLRDSLNNVLTSGNEVVALSGMPASSTIGPVFFDAMTNTYDFDVTNINVDFVEFAATVEIGGMPMPIDDKATVNFLIIDIDADNLHDPEDPDTANTDTDGDGINDGADASPNGEVPAVYPDADGDGIRDRADVDDNGTDFDGDGINDEFDLDSVNPIITVIGGDVSVEQGTTYNDLGATALDNQTGDLTADIVTTFAYDDGINPPTIVFGVDTSVVGIYTVFYNVTDVDGNPAEEKSRTVTVTEDATVPVITLIGDDPVTLEAGDLYVDAGATGFDSFDLGGNEVTSDIDTVLNPIAGGHTSLVPDTYTITYSLIDAAGNVAAPVTREVNVVDTTAPEITLLGDAEVFVAQGNAYNDDGATASDIVDGDLTTSIVETGSVDVNTAGQYILSYDVTDAAGNIATTVNRTVNVTADAVPPVITLNGVSPDTVVEGAVYTDPGATATDNIDGAIPVIVTGSVNTSIPGTYQLQYNVTDSAGNAAVEVVRDVEVTADAIIPVITLLGNVSETLERGGTYVDAGATATDNLQGDISGSIVVTNPVDTSVVGVYTVSYDVTDNRGNAADTVTRSVEVTADVTIPVINLIGGDVSLEQWSIYVDQGATATDNFDGTITNSIVVNSNVDTTIPGVYTVTYNVSDSSGNPAVEVTRNVTVTPDVTTPVINLIGNNPQTIEAGNAYNELGANVVDNEPGLTVSINSTGVNTSLPGTYSVFYNVTDSAGNASSTVIRTVIVEDTTAPVINLIGDAIITLEAGDTYQELGADVIDNDAGVTVVIDDSAINNLVPGDYEVTYNATDAENNVAIEVIRTVQVVDTTAPVITLLGDNPQIIQELETYVESGAEATDIVDDNATLTAAIVIDSSAVNNLVPGVYQVTYSVTDAAGNSSNESRSVEVTADIPVVQADSYAILEDDTLIADDADGTSTPDNNDNSVLVNDNDPDNDGLTVVEVGVFSAGGIGGSIQMTAEGTFAYTPPNDVSGTATFEYTVTDGTHSVPSSLSIDVLAVNDAPSFNVLGDVDVTGLISSDNTSVEVVGFVENISFGPTDESTQEVLDYVISVQDSNAVIQSIDIDNSGMLSLDINYNNSGVAIINVELQDNGGTDNQGEDTSAPVEFMVIYINDDLIFYNGFESIADALDALTLSESIEAGDLKVVEDIDRNVYVFTFFGHQAILSRSYLADEIAVIIEYWMHEVSLMQN